jgi:hypothetical protein
MNILIQRYSPKNYSDKNVLSTPKFQGFKYLHKKYNNESEKIENKINKSTSKKPIKERIILSEKKREMNNSMNSIISNSTEKVNYFNSVFYNDHKKKENKENNIERQLSFDEKSENYLFSSDINKIHFNKKNNNTINIVSLNNKDKEKKENDENFNYDLPLEEDKTSDIFNYNSNQENSNKCNFTTKFQEYNNIILNLLNNDKNKITINYKKKTNNIENKSNKKPNKTEKNKQYFSFDGENQINGSNKEKGDKSKVNNDKKINMINIKNNIYSLLQNNNIIIEDNNNSNKNEISSIHISPKRDLNEEKGKEKKNKINNKIIKRLINTPNKEYEKNFKFNFNIELVKNKINKHYSIQKEKRLINKTLIGNLTFNAFNSLNSLKIKKVLMNDDEYFNDIKKKIKVM